MSEWSEGYVSDVAYTYGYYPELNPDRIRLAFLSSGLVFPKIGTACELGFGQGLSTNIHAAGSVTSWFGTDFNPAQAGFAQELSAASGANAHLFDQAFDEFASRTDLPDFDFISLHGIWSWISDANRAVIVDFIKRKLKVGGVLYVSYNTMPGWANFAPMRHLMTQHADIMGSEGKGIVPRIDDAIVFAERLLESNPKFARDNPAAGERIKKIKDQNRHYLAHEYFNRDWHPMHFSTMADWLEPAKLQFACSANYMDHIESVNLTPSQQELLNELPDPMFRQTVRDFMVNQQFRRDYWVRGARKLGTVERIDGLRKVNLVLTSPWADIKLAITGAAGTMNLSEAIYRPLIDAMADYQPKTLEQLEVLLKDKQISILHLMQSALILINMGHMECVQEQQDARVAEQASRLNRHLFTKAISSYETAFLVSPLSGSGIQVMRFQQLFLMAMQNGKSTPAEWAEFALGLLLAQGGCLVKDGKPLVTPEENLAKLLEEAEHFRDTRLPVLKGLKIA